MTTKEKIIKIHEILDRQTKILMAANLIANDDMINEDMKLFLITIYFIQIKYLQKDIQVLVAIPQRKLTKLYPEIWN